MNEKQKSVIAMIISSFGFALMGMFLKLTGDIPVIQKAYVRSVIIMIATFIMFRHSGFKIKSIKHHKLLLLRATLGTLGIMLNYYALDRLILSDASVIFRISTLVLIIFSWIFLKEKTTKNQLISIVIAFIGVIFVVKPSFSVEIIPYISAILGAIVAENIKF
jgi:drug/metabolite transporter (DMT)-like permease